MKTRVATTSLLLAVAALTALAAFFGDRLSQPTESGFGPTSIVRQPSSVHRG